MLTTVTRKLYVRSPSATRR